MRTFFNARVHILYCTSSRSNVSCRVGLLRERQVSDQVDVRLIRSRCCVGTNDGWIKRDTSYLFHLNLKSQYNYEVQRIRYLYFRMWIKLKLRSESL